MAARREYWTTACARRKLPMVVALTATHSREEYAAISIASIRTTRRRAVWLLQLRACRNGRGATGRECPRAGDADRGNADRAPARNERVAGVDRLSHLSERPGNGDRSADRGVDRYGLLDADAVSTGFPRSGGRHRDGDTHARSHPDGGCRRRRCGSGGVSGDCGSPWRTGDGSAADGRVVRTSDSSTAVPVLEGVILSAKREGPLCTEENRALLGAQGSLVADALQDDNQLVSFGFV